MLLPGTLFRSALLIFVLLNFSLFAFSQKTDSTKIDSHLGGAVTVTNNGISFIPNLTLGKPAIVFDLSMGKEKLSFEPQFRFALEGKPWSFVFWWRYKLLESERVKINIGAHPAIAFKTMTFSSDTVSKDAIVAQRYLAAELAPSLPVSISALINKTIHSKISASKNFIWNASLIYTFNNKYTKVS